MDTNIQSSVYFMIFPEKNIIKIGISSDPFERLNAFKCKYGHSLKLMGFVEGGIKLERELHNRFDKYRLKIGDFGINETEWFLFEGELKQYIKTEMIQNKLSDNDIDKTTKLSLKESTKKDLKELKYDMRVDSFDEVVKKLIKTYKKDEVI